MANNGVLQFRPALGGVQVFCIGDVRQANCDQICENTAMSVQIHLVEYLSISSVLMEIISFCKL